MNLTAEQAKALADTIDSNVEDDEVVSLNRPLGYGNDGDVEVTIDSDVFLIQPDGYVS